MKLPDIPKTWIVIILLIGMVVMRCFGIDSWTTSALSIIIGWLVGVKMEQSRLPRK
jgi:uncharacterized membrane protein AbrB (regulator of aidB expression)